MLQTMNPNKALWEKGDFTRIAATMRASGEALVNSLGVRRGLKVLDLGCGDGTTAIPEARLGADVLGVDIAGNLVEAGRRRAAAESLSNCRFEEGDASNLDALATLVAQILKTSSAYSPPPPEGFVSPMTWGVESHVEERFGKAGVPPEKISFARDTHLFEFPGTSAAFVAEFRNYYPPTMNAFEAARGNGRQDELQRELEHLFEAQNTAEQRDATRIPATFLRVTVSV